jgi:glucosamine kinase
MSRAIGVDAGGSKTLGLVVDENGRVLLRACSAGANPRSVGRTQSAQRLREVLTQLVRVGDVDAVCIGAAGAGRTEDRAFVERVARTVVPSGAALAVCTDAEIALNAGTTDRPAVVVLAGTGSLVYGEAADGRPVRCGGHGPLLGDGAGGYDIGLCALRRCADVLDGILPPSRLTDDILAELGRTTLDALVDWVMRWPPDVSAIADLAPRVAQAAQAGDAGAKEIIAGACDDLARRVQVVCSQVRTPEPLPVVCHGGLFDGVPDLFITVRASAHATGPAAVGRPTLQPAHGAALKALRLAQAHRRGSP